MSDLDCTSQAVTSRAPLFNQARELGNCFVSRRAYSAGVRLPPLHSMRPIGGASHRTSESSSVVQGRASGEWSPESVNYLVCSQTAQNLGIAHCQ